MIRLRKLIPHAAGTNSGLSWLAGVGLPRQFMDAEIANADEQLQQVRPILFFFAALHLVAAAAVSQVFNANHSIAELAWLAGAAIEALALGCLCALPKQRESGAILLASKCLVLSACLAGTLWGTLPMLSGEPSVLFAAAALMVLGMVAFMGAPLAGIAFLISVSVGQQMANSGAASASVGAIAIIGTILLSISGRRSFAMRVAKAMRDHDSGRFERLASTFEVCGNGWFWETDSEGKLTYVSSTFGDALGMNPEELKGKPLDQLVATDVASADSLETDHRALSFHLQAQLPFYDTTIPVRFPVGVHWWSLSGSPIFSERGRFIGFSGIGTDLTEVRKSEDRASQLARFDPLTGLANRVTIRETIDTAIMQNQGEQMPCALLLLDLDRFKMVNDTLGHPVGDKLLEQVADRLSTLVGTDGRVGRLGGDEFAIVVRDAAVTKRLELMATRMIEYLSAAYTVDGHRIVIGGSVGIAIGPQDGQTVDALMRNADLALYAAKADGRGKHRFFEHSMHKDAETRRRLEDDLRSAVADDALSLHFQPLVDTNSEMLVGFETLARWNHPVHGDISPTKFIPIAEEAGLIESIGEWVIRSACTSAAMWPSDITVAVNLSPLQFNNPDFTTIVVNALAQSGLPAERLELEITEGVFLQENSTTRSTLQQLSTLGVHLTLDDFGTGYSSLGYLSRAPFKKIKIDRSFVAGASAPDGQKSAIIRAIVALAESLGMATTAEGAETHDDLDVVRDLGCTQVQGFIYGKPVDAAAAAALACRGAPMVPVGPQSTRERRVAVLRRAVFLHNGHRRYARLRNVSATGAMFEANWAPKVGDTVHVTIDEKTRRSGTVRWTQADRFGILFDQYYAEPKEPERAMNAFERAVNAA